MERIVHGDSKHKLYLLLDFTSRPGAIADPWYTGNFDATFTDVMEGCSGLLKYLKSQGTDENYWQWYTQEKTRMKLWRVLSYFRVFAKGRLQLLLINTIVLHSPCFMFTHNRERTLWRACVFYAIQRIWRAKRADTAHIGSLPVHFCYKSFTFCLDCLFVPMI